MTRTLSKAGDLAFGCAFIAAGMTLVVILGASERTLCRRTRADPGSTS